MNSKTTNSGVPSFCSLPRSLRLPPPLLPRTHSTLTHVPPVPLHLQTEEECGEYSANIYWRYNELWKKLMFFLTRLLRNEIDRELNLFLNSRNGRPTSLRTATGRCGGSCGRSSRRRFAVSPFHVLWFPAPTGVYANHNVGEVMVSQWMISNTGNPLKVEIALGTHNLTLWVTRSKISECENPEQSLIIAISWIIPSPQSKSHQIPCISKVTEINELMNAFYSRSSTHSISSFA